MIYYFSSLIGCPIVHLNLSIHAYMHTYIQTYRTYIHLPTYLLHVKSKVPIRPARWINKNAYVGSMSHVPRGPKVAGSLYECTTVHDSKNDYPDSPWLAALLLNCRVPNIQYCSISQLPGPSFLAHFWRNPPMTL